MEMLKRRSMNGGNEGAGSGENLSKVAWSHGILGSATVHDLSPVFLWPEFGGRNSHRVTGRCCDRLWDVLTVMDRFTLSCDVMTVRTKGWNENRQRRALVRATATKKADQTDRTELDAGVLSKQLTWPSRRLGQKICGCCGLIALDQMLSDWAINLRHSAIIAR